VHDFIHEDLESEMNDEVNMADFLPQAPPTNHFSPKRFRRFPRFTVFLNKDEDKPYEKENSISLNP
jgi:hypothetical protein